MAEKSVKESNDYTQYLDPEFISKFSNLQITTRMLLEGFMLGIHSSPLHGFSAEFSDRKQYSTGDSTRFIDWKVYAKTGKYYIKQFEDETNIYANVFLDRTSSMAFKSEKSKYSKLDYGRQLAAAVIQLLLKQKDAVGFGQYAERLKEYVPPKSSKQQLKNLLVKLADEKMYDANVTHRSLDDISFHLNRAGITVIISDFLEEPEQVIQKILLLKRQKQDVIVFMIADDDEYNFGYNKLMLFKDSETNEKLEIHSGRIGEEYRKKYNDLIKLYDHQLTSHKIYFKFITTKTPFNVPLTEVVLLRSVRK